MRVWIGVYVFTELQTHKRKPDKVLGGLTSALYARQSAMNTATLSIGRKIRAPLTTGGRQPRQRGLITITEQETQNTWIAPKSVTLYEDT